MFLLNSTQKIGRTKATIFVPLGDAQSTELHTDHRPSLFASMVLGGFLASMHNGTWKQLKGLKTHQKKPGNS